MRTLNQLMIVARDRRAHIDCKLDELNHSDTLQNDVDERVDILEEMIRFNFEQWDKFMTELPYDELRLAAAMFPEWSLQGKTIKDHVLACIERVINPRGYYEKLAEVALRRTLREEDEQNKLVTFEFDSDQGPKTYSIKVGEFEELLGMYGFEKGTPIEEKIVTVLNFILDENADIPEDPNEYFTGILFSGVHNVRVTRVDD